MISGQEPRLSPMFLVSDTVSKMYKVLKILNCGVLFQLLCPLAFVAISIRSNKQYLY